MGAATFAIASLASTAIGAVTSAVGQRREANAAAAAANYNATVARNNQIIANRTARATRQRAAIEAQDIRDRTRAEVVRERLRTQQLMGHQRAVLASNGVLIDQDVAADILASTAGVGEQEALTIQRSGARQARSVVDEGRLRAFELRSQGAGFGAEAGLQTARATNLQEAGRSSAVGTLIGGAGSVASRWYRFNEAGAFD